ncbi:MAG: rhomboid family intramembrane serine protease [Rhodospirillaceae bacterium]|nr:rhomboid family intramembrane serine protease [Rhodospirillaceae bacterium]
MAFFRPFGPPSQPRREPILNVPPVTQWLLLVLVGVHLVRLALPDRLDMWVILTFGFIPARYTVPGAFDWGAAAAPIASMLLHGGWLHLTVNGLALLAFGAGLERRIGGGRMLGLALVSGLAAAATQGAAFPDGTVPMIGASGAISGIFGAVLRLLPGRRPGAGLRGLWPVIVVWVAINVAFGFARLPELGGEVAWVAHLGGFAAGLILFGLFDRHPRPPA